MPKGGAAAGVVGCPCAVGAGAAGAAGERESLTHAPDRALAPRTRPAGGQSWRYPATWPARRWPAGRWRRASATPAIRRPSPAHRDRRARDRAARHSITASRARAASVHPSPEGGGWPLSRSEGGRVGVIDTGVQTRMRISGKIPHPPRFARHPPPSGEGSAAASLALMTR